MGAVFSVLLVKITLVINARLNLNSLLSKLDTANIKERQLVSLSWIICWHAGGQGSD